MAYGRRNGQQRFAFVDAPHFAFAEILRSRCQLHEMVYFSVYSVYTIELLSEMENHALTFHRLRSKPLLRSASPPCILAEWLPNCIALFFLTPASANPSFFAANLSIILSPTPRSSLGSSL